MTLRSALSVPLGYTLTVRHFASSHAPELSIECNRCSAWRQQITMRGEWRFPRNPGAARIPDRTATELVVNMVSLINAWFMHADDSPACYAPGDRRAVLPSNIADPDNVFFLHPASERPST